MIDGGIRQLDENYPRDGREIVEIRVHHMFP